MTPYLKRAVRPAAGVLIAVALTVPGATPASAHPVTPAAPDTTAAMTATGGLPGQPFHASVKSSSTDLNESTPAGPNIGELERAGTRGRNDDLRTAQRVGSRSVIINGALSPASPATTAISPGAEDDGSIRLAERTGLGPQRPGITTTGIIGDGPHTTTGDLDFYRIDAAAGATIIIKATADTDTLDPAIILYDAAGTRVDFNDERVNDINPVVTHRVTTAGIYYALITASGSAPSDPFDAGSGSGAASTGPYHLSIVSAFADVDVYGVHLRPGDVLGAATTGSPDKLTVLDPSGRDVHGSTGDASTLYPAASPLARGRLSTDHIAVADGWHYVEVEGSGGSYRLTLIVHRPGLENTGRVQTFYLDYDGAQVDPAIFASSGLPTPNPAGPRDFPPLRSFLPKWGLADRDNAALEKAVTATVRRNLESVGRGSSVHVVSSADSPDLFGRRDVSRVVVGGTIAASGLPTIGISQSIDPGNFATDETAVVLLDILSAPASSDPFSANAYLAGSRHRVAYLGEVLGDYISHEAGHLLGNWHTQPTNEQQGLMDNTNIAQIVAGPDGIGGTADDDSITFAANQYIDVEGFTGTEDTAARVAAALSH